MGRPGLGVGLEKLNLYDLSLHLTCIKIVESLLGT